MKLARHFEVHLDFDLATPQIVGGSERFAHNEFNLAIESFKDIKNEDRYNVRLIAVFIDDWDEQDTIILAFHYPDDPEPNESNAKAHRDWRMRQGEPDRDR